MPRIRYAIPDFVTAALEEAGLMAAYKARPPYQQNDYIMWITKAKFAGTQQRRVAQMLDELRQGNVYMGMEYSGRVKPD
jgi:uncharacterized protein YdeI (YjbR/CyaY-like superfamily)